MKQFVVDLVLMMILAMFRGWGLEPKHNIFLSHSGKQKDFTERLWEELRRVHYFPFFDKCPDSLLKGDEFPPAIIQAARQCHVAILVLSEEFFTRSRWPMIELNEFVKAQASINSNLKILPLFFKISVEEFKDVERRKRWQKIWEGWVDEGIKNNKTHKLEVADLIHALSEVEKKNGMEFVEEIGERTYIANVVGAVCNLVPAYVKYDVSHVQSLPRLCKVLLINMVSCVSEKQASTMKVQSFYCIALLHELISYNILI